MPAIRAASQVGVGNLQDADDSEKDHNFEGVDDSTGVAPLEKNDKTERVLGRARLSDDHVLSQSAAADALSQPRWMKANGWPARCPSSRLDGRKSTFRKGVTLPPQPRRDPQNLSASHSTARARPWRSAEHFYFLFFCASLCSFI